MGGEVWFVLEDLARLPEVSGQNEGLVGVLSFIYEIGYVFECF